MSINTQFHNWQQHLPPDDPRFNRCSPNLSLLGTYLGKRFGMTDLGCYGERDVRGGELPSSHSHGAAIDRRYGDGKRVLALTQIIPFLINWSKELHVQAIHDYFGCRIWRAGRTPNTSDAHSDWWRPQTPNPATGMGQAWALYLHIETDLNGWSDRSAIAVRLGNIPDPDPVPIPGPGGSFVHQTVKQGDTNADVYALQVILRYRAGQTDIVADGVFGAQTDFGVRNLQRFCGIGVDGIVGPVTWGVLDGLANS